MKTFTSERKERLLRIRVSKERIEQIIQQPLLHPFSSTSRCIRWLALQLLRERAINADLMRAIAEDRIELEE